ncbi:hypothetical protein E3T61_19150 [Cryobacterium lactosi]|uniref:Polysaccharide chain length determinant N-terminal domain-containing protein n=1 Tax=Cryobacterium lactosi TaxID=1259202 RepID=A0A4R9BHA8_9MICO|nr:hypothetical protein [Cryobacterium lactosi]TFD84572.1 hypothetical protein E3T61_19150 [Cryobacterium lactosi]
MTFREILSAMLRRWYITILVLTAAAVATAVLANDGGTYTTKTVVSFTRPATSSLSPYNGTTDPSVIAFAGTVAQVVNDGRPPARYSESDAPYYGAGVRQGVLVELANSGSQWVSTFGRSDIELQIVGRSYDWVESQQRDLVDQVLAVADAEQASLAIPSADRIRAIVAPLTMRIEYVSPSRRGQAAAAAAMLAVALTVSAWGSVMVDRRLSRKRTTPATPPRIPTRHILEGSPT